MQPGIHKISMENYLALIALSSGMIHTLLTQSPAHALHQQLSDSDEPSSVSDFGTAVHDAVLEGTDRIVSIDAPDWRTKAAKEARDFARLEGKIPLLAHKVEAVMAAATEARAFVDRTELAGLLDDGESEVTLVWDDGALCKARPDRISHALKVVCHLKTTEGSAAPGPFGRTVDNMGYDLTLAFYERGAAACELEGYRHVILAVEQNAPYGCALYDLSPAKAAIAAARVERAIRTWQHCVGTNIWPGYDTRVHSLEPTSWQIAQEEIEQYSRPFTAAELREGIPL